MIESLIISDYYLIILAKIKETLKLKDLADF